MVRGYGATVLATAALVGCTPQSAEIVEGSGSEFATFVATSTSPIYLGERVDFPEGAPSLDCRKLDEGEERLPDALDVCDVDWNKVHETWMRRDGYRIYREPLEPWRGEAILTSEGDFQITFHHRLSKGEDFRFAFVIDPVFQPKSCEQVAPGEVDMVDIDGAWVDEWSADEPGKRVFFLNSGAYQFNPSKTSDVWVLPDEWSAGYAQAKFAGEDFFLRSTRYGLPKAYATFELDDYTEPKRADLFYAGLPAGADPESSSDFTKLRATVQTVASDSKAEFEKVGWDLEPMVHDNAWRAPDGLPAGLDSWLELHYNWVKIDDGSDLTEGGSATGEFNLVFDAAESQSRLFVKGTFAVDKIKTDRWVTDDVMGEKLAENGTVLCGQDASQAD